MSSASFGGFGKKWGMASSDWAHRQLQQSSLFKMYIIPGDDVDDDGAADLAKALEASRTSAVEDDTVDSDMSTVASTPSSKDTDTSTSAAKTTRSAEETSISEASLAGKREDLVLRYFMDIRAKAKAVEQSALRAEHERQMRIQKEEQRLCGASTLSEMVPWLTLDQCVCVLEMKDDNIEMAMNHCLSSDPTAVMLGLADYTASRQAAHIATLADESDKAEKKAMSKVAPLSRSMSFFSPMILISHPNFGCLFVLCVL